MKRNCLSLFPLLCSILLLSACKNNTEVNISNLRCEFLNNPSGMGITNPRLSWELNSDKRGLKQKSYHILVASSLENLNADNGDLWNSEKESETSILVEYNGKPLKSRDVCFWKVKVKTNQGDSPWSKPASWSIGLLNETDWQAGWIGLDRMFKGDVFDRSNSRLAARYFRKEFSATQKPEKATVFISGLGLYKLFINGQKIGNQELSPTPTDYTKSVKYNTFDVTDIIQEGSNAIGTVLGNGRFFSMRPPGVPHGPVAEIKHFGYPKMILQLELDYPDGSKQVITSDNSWKVTAEGPIRANNEFDGEEYDARKEMPGWDNTGFNDHAWLQAETVQSPGGELEAQLNPNIKIMETITPVNISEPKKGTYILDMGQNMVGWIRMKVKGKEGDKVSLRFAEVLKEDGTLYMDNIRGALVTDIYTLKSSTEEHWEPSFVYHGFRYVEITGFPGVPTVNDFEGKIVYDEMEITGKFETSDPTINQIYKNAYWGIRGNYRGMPTDCPQRDERMGWLGDRAVGSHGESFVFDNYHLYVKWLDDIEQTQLENGSLSDVAPAYWAFYGDNMTWPAAYLTIANMIYEQYGDPEPIKKHYKSMKKWMSYMRKTYMKDHIMTKDIYGDWCMPANSVSS
ncbi:MAG: family 78 glycoside hydrolase catalytic domain [Tannerella sp.]|nr:family 78 glycoside hydrolase catalytic domain [Tannerella sp.]